MNLRVQFNFVQCESETQYELSESQYPKRSHIEIEKGQLFMNNRENISSLLL